MKNLSKLVVLALVTLVGTSSFASKAHAVDIDFGRYAAVAYSSKTGKFGYAWDWGSRATAESVALMNCKADDAKVVGWVKGGWLVLAVADDNAYGVGYTFGEGASNADARQRAIKDCMKHSKSTGPIKIKVVLCSGDYAPVVND